MTKQPTRTTLPVRLAIRREGKYVNAYVAKADTMTDAMHIGSMLTTLAEGDDKAFELWKEAMTQCLRGVVAAILGETPDMITQAAPEHEKGGEA